MLEDFERELRRRKLKENSVYLYISSIQLAERFLGKPLDKTTTKKDIESYLDSISDSKANTIASRLISLKIYFKWLYGMKRGYPEVVDIPLPKGRGNNMISADLLTEDEILRLINACYCSRDKALISLLYDSACRIGEITGLNIEDVVIEDEKIGHILVDGKTGRREVPLSLSIPSLKDWLNTHPQRNNPKSPLFVSLKGFDGHRLIPQSVEYALRQIKKRAGISKPIHPHLFRHSRLTQLDKKGLSHTAMKYYAGWSRNSNMPSVYSHFSAQDTKDLIYEADGISQPRAKPKILLEPVKCPKCQTPNDKTNRFCYLCGVPMDDTSRKELEIEEIVKMLIKTDPNLSKVLSERIESLSKSP